MIAFPFQAIHTYPESRITTNPVLSFGYQKTAPRALIMLCAPTAGTNGINRGFWDF